MENNAIQSTATIAPVSPVVPPTNDDLLTPQEQAAYDQWFAQWDLAHMGNDY